MVADVTQQECNNNKCYASAFKYIYIYIYICKDQIWLPNPKGGWSQDQKAQNNEFVESGLENWVLVNQKTSKVGLDDKRMKIDKFKLKKVLLNTVRGEQFLYIDS